MSKPAAKPVPEGYHTLTPFLICKDALRALEFYQRAFGAQEISKLVGPDGKLMHAALRVGDSVLMLTDECPEMGGFDPLHFGGSAVTIHLSVADADASFARAVAAGATARMPVMEMFWGARYGVFSDPFGHVWSVATQVQELSPEEIQANAAKACAEHAASAAA
jgi:PhnB protein